MAIDSIIKKRIGRELREHLLLGIRTGARRGVEQYQRLKESEPDEALRQLKRAIDLPNRARARINEFIRLYGQPLLVECIAMSDGLTIIELNAELTALENYCKGLYDRRQLGEGWDSIAADIEANVEDESLKWIFPFPEGYTDIWGN